MATKSSIHIKPCNVASSEAHNRRTAEYMRNIGKSKVYVVSELSANNEQWINPDFGNPELQAHYEDIKRMVKEKTGRAMQEKERLTAQNGKEPTVEEIAKSLDLRREDVVLALESIVEPVSLYEPVFSDGGDTIYVMDQVGDKNDDKNWLDEIALKEAMNDLSDREKRIMGMRFFQGKTQMEVAAEIGISQAQVSRLEKCALDKIKKDL